MFRNDKTLFITLGERQRAAPAQDLSKTLGKVVRINRDGSDRRQPQPGRRRAARHLELRPPHRPQGAALHPSTGELWQEQSTARKAATRSTSRAAARTGWPNAAAGCNYGDSYPGTDNTSCRIGGAGGVHAPTYVEPLTYWVPTSQAPSGLAFYTGSLMPEWQGNLFMGALAGTGVWRLTLGGNTITAREKLGFSELSAHPRHPPGPDGALYALTDGSGGRIVHRPLTRRKKSLRLRAQSPLLITRNSMQPSSWMNADLHCHSSVSDGTLTPEALAQRAKSARRALGADRPRRDRRPAARAEAALALGLALPHRHRDLGQLLRPDGAHRRPRLRRRQRRTRPRPRRHAAAAASARWRWPRAWRRPASAAASRARWYVGNPELISRTHFARYLVETGVCADTSRCSAASSPKASRVSCRTAGPACATRGAGSTDAGGMAVIAHPARYRFTANEEHALFSEFKAQWRARRRVVTGSHSAAEALPTPRWRRSTAWPPRAGSDFHSPTSHTDLGALPELPGQLTPVWGC